MYVVYKVMVWYVKVK